MLVPIIISSWADDEKETIKRRMKALASNAGQALQKDWRKIDQLGPGEELWLYSHGSSTLFAGMSAPELSGFLVETAAMPRGKRRVVLKGCQTGAFAATVQELLNKVEGYAGVTVVGFEGVASITTKTGAMKVRRKFTEKKVAVSGALASIAASRSEEAQGLSISERRERSKKARLEAEKEATYEETVYDKGLNMFVAKDKREMRRIKRDSVKQESSEKDSSDPVEASDESQQQQSSSKPKRKLKRIIDDEET